jgi:hypothetical protein
VRWRRGRWLRVEADALDDCAGDHGIVGSCDHERRCAAHSDGVVALAVAVGA